jgi:hypothetical protein
MKDQLVVLCLLAFVACKSATSETPADGNNAGTLDDSGARARYVDTCTKACERSQSMRAVGAEMIAAQCKSGCEADWALPLVTTATDLKHGDRVRVRGDLSVTSAGSGSGPVLVLADGTRLPVHLENTGIAEASPLAGTVIAVASVVRDGEGVRLDKVVAVLAAGSASDLPRAP